MVDGGIYCLFRMHPNILYSFKKTEREWKKRKEKKSDSNSIYLWYRNDKFVRKTFHPLSLSNTGGGLFCCSGFNLFVAIKVLVKWTFTLKMISSEQFSK